MLSRAAESIGLHYRRPPSPERSRLDDWFLRAQAERRQPPPVPFFPEVHEEVTRSWKAPFSARSRPSASSVLTTLDGGAAQGYVEVPPVERAIAMQLCPQGAAAWRGNPRLPSRACKFSSALTAKAYGAAGQAASALHAMALLQVHQAKALKQLHEGDADPGVLQELRTATDLALRATKVTARALGQTMSTLVVQERHLWLTLADMRESDKHRFLDSPISQAGLFGEAVEDFAQQFSQVQGQSVHLSVEPGCPCLACRSRGPTGEGRDTAGPSSRDGVRALQRPLLHRSQETRWVTSNLGPACSEPGPCQAPVQDVDAETPLSMRPSLRLGCSDRPERRLLPCLDPPSIPLCVRRASIPVGPPLRAPQPVGASGQPGKEQTLPYAEDLFSRQGVGLGQPHSTSLRGACSVNAEMPGVSPAQEGGSTETFSEAPGAYGILSRYHAARIASYETASALASRPSPEMGMAPRHIPGLTHPVLPSHLQPMVGSCLSSGRSSPRASIQARCCFNRRLCHGLGGHVQRARSRGALDRAPAAVAYQLPRVAGSIACSAPLQNAATREAYTGPFGQHCDRCVHQPPGKRSTLPSHVATRPPSPPLESEASEVASRRSCPRRAQSCSRRALTSARPSGRMATPPRGTPAELETLRGRSGRPVCLPGHVSLPVVFLPVRGDPRYRCAGMQLASGLTQICVSPSEPSRTDPVQGQGGRGASPLGGALLAQPDVVSRTDAPRDSPSLANSSEEGSTFSERGHPLAPAPRLVESPRMVLGRDAEVLSGLPPAVVNTIASARALSTRQAYRLKWNLFVDWCSPRREDPRRCPIAVVLSFLQDGLERRLSPSTLKVYVAAIAAHHDAVDGKSLGKHDLVIRFLRGARRLNPPRPHLVPSWDLPSVLSALRGAPFEPLQSVELKFLSLKTVLLSALATVKRVGDLQAFSVDDSCLEFGPADSHVILRPRPGYVPKVPTMPFRDQVVNLQALPWEEADPAIALLCPVRALRIYVDRTQSFRTSDQLFVCFGGQQKGRPVSKQRLAHWIVEAIVLAYQARRLPCPLGVRAHSTRGVASSWALARGASIADICKAAGWATPNTLRGFTISV